MTLTLDPVPAAESQDTDARAGRRSWLGDPAWARPALWALLAGTTVLYLWNLSASGWANEFYAAAAQAGSQSWKAWLFASLDAGNAITVDKPPAAMWVMGLSMRLFGVNSWALLVPQALMGVASVALLHATVRRWFGPAAGLLAGAALALTPVAVLMFRFNNPDALLTLLMIAAAYTTVRAVEHASWKWLALTGTLLGFAFLTKMLQAFLVLPGFALVYLIAAPTGLLKRVRDLLIGAGALIVSGGWFVLLVSLWPASARPYIAGSTNNSLWQLAVGYNGLGRIFGGQGNRGGGGPGGSLGGGPGAVATAPGAVASAPGADPGALAGSPGGFGGDPGAFGGGGPGGGGGGGFGGNVGFGGSAGLGRMFGSSFGPEISWLLPAALIALVALLLCTARAPRTDRTRAAALIWGGWTLVTGLTFSFMGGTVHPYYAIALAPGIAALVAIGARVLWTRRDQLLPRAALSAMVMSTGIWDFVLLGRVTWAPGLRWVVLVTGILAGVALLLPSGRLRRVGVVTVAAVAVAVTGTASTAWAVGTAGTPHNGSIPTSGPAGASDGSGRGGFPGGGSRRGNGGFPGANGNGSVPGNNGGTASALPGGNAQGGTPGGTAPDGNSPAGNTPGANPSGDPSGASPGGNAAGGNPSGDTSGATPGGDPSGSNPGGNASGGFPGGGPGGGRGGFGGAQEANAELVTLLKATGNRWAAATNGSMQAAPLQLASGRPVMAIGGFTGSDPSPTPAEFQAYVRAGEIHYYLGGGGRGMGGSRGGGSEIAQWVEQNFTATTVGGSTVYDLTKPTTP